MRQNKLTIFLLLELLLSSSFCYAKNDTDNLSPQHNPVIKVGQVSTIVPNEEQINQVMEFSKSTIRKTYNVSSTNYKQVFSEVRPFIENNLYKKTEKDFKEDTLPELIKNKAISSIEYHGKETIFVEYNAAHQIIAWHIAMPATLRQRGIENYSVSVNIHPLMLSGSIELTSFLLEYKPKLNLQNKDGNTATHLATRPGKEVILSRLVELGADLSIKNEKNETPLEFSLAKMFTLAANYLFDKSPHSEKTLHMAISARNFNLMSKLIREGIFVSSSMIEKVANIDNNKNIQIEKILKTMFRYNANFNEVNWANIHNPIRVEFIQALLQKKQIKDEKKQLNSAINTNHHSLKKTSKIKL